MKKRNFKKIFALGMLSTQLIQVGLTPVFAASDEAQEVSNVVQETNVKENVILDNEETPAVELPAEEKNEVDTGEEQQELPVVEVPVEESETDIEKEVEVPVEVEKEDIENLQVEKKPAPIKPEAEKVETEKKETETKETKGEKGLALTSENFPDGALRAELKLFDVDKDGYLSPKEIAAVTNMLLKNPQITDLTGIKHFTSLAVLDIKETQLTTIDVAGMTSLTKIYYHGNSELKTLDFRNCPNLIVGFHSSRNETVYISAGMTNYIGCHLVPNHTGNIIIDLTGVYEVNQDGSKTIDLKTLISPVFINLFEQVEQKGYDVVTKKLTIPAGEVKSDYQVGKTSGGSPTMWTFITELGKIDSYVARFDTNGGSIVEAQMVEAGQLAVEPEIAPTKLGFIFSGWYADPACTTLADFTQPVTSDITYYAQWVPEIIEFTVTFDSQGGSLIADQTIKSGEAAVEPVEVPTKLGFTFAGWYTEPEFTTVVDFSQPILADVTYYAKWEPLELIVIEQIITPVSKTPVSQTPVSQTQVLPPKKTGAPTKQLILPKAGLKAEGNLSLIGLSLSLCTGLFYFFRRFK